MTTRAITQIPVNFAYQSDFDNALLAGAIGRQAPGAAIVASTLQQAQTPGVGVALHPSSESPVAIRFKGGTADSAVLVLTPGQTFHVGEFKSFEFGLPFGWLGGGTSLLYVLNNEKANVDFGAALSGPVICHRASFVIEGPGFPGTLRQNWPGTFPWQSAYRTAGALPLPQPGTPVLPLSMDVALCRLALSPAAPVTLTMIWQGTDPFDLDSAGALATGNLSTYDLTFPAVPAGSNALPLAWIPPEIHRLASSVGGVNFIDPTGALAGEYLRIARYCRF